MTTVRLPPIEKFLVTLLREKLPDTITVSTWTPDIDYRKLPLINVRALGGNIYNINFLGRPGVEITVYAEPNLDTQESGMVVARDIYYEVRQIVYDAVDNQTVIPGLGHLNFAEEFYGPTVFDSAIEDSNRVQGIIQFGVRAPRL